MKAEYTFNKLDHSDALVEYAEKRSDKMGKFEMKPTHCHWVFSMQRHECKAEIILKGAYVRLQATASCEDHYTAVDAVIEKMSKQLAKRKNRVQDRKHGPVPVRKKSVA